MQGEVHLDDIGTVFRALIVDGSTAKDISTATTKQLIFKKPSGSKLTKDGSFYTDGTDGILQYTTVSGDLDEVGLWKVQGYVIIGTNEHKSDIYSFRVYYNL